MDSLTNIVKQQIATGSFIDSKNKEHQVVHSIIFTDEEKRDLEEKIAEDLFNIFTKKIR